jgi:hypothetical protein
MVKTDLPKYKFSTKPRLTKPQLDKVIQNLSLKLQIE